MAVIVGGTTEPLTMGRIIYKNLGTGDSVTTSASAIQIDFSNVNQLVAGTFTNTSGAGTLTLEGQFENTDQSVTGITGTIETIRVTFENGDIFYEMTGPFPYDRVFTRDAAGETISSSPGFIDYAVDEASNNLAFAGPFLADFFSGDDSLTGTFRDDDLRGYAGADSLVGGDGADTLFGFDGDDVLVGGAGADTLNGGGGADRGDWALFTSSADGVTVRLWSGDAEGGDAEGDSITNMQNLRGSNSASDTLSGNRFGNILEGLDGDDVLAGREGDDVLRGGFGDDRIDGGDGADFIVGGPGEDRLVGGDGDDTARGYSQNDTLDGDDGADLLFGNLGADLLRGGNGEDLLWGNSGNDRLFGRDGDDELYGGLGGDVLHGGRGTDTLLGGGGGDVFQFQDGDGLDIIRDFTLSGPDRDRIDLSRLLDGIDYQGSTPVADGVVRAIDAGDDALVQVELIEGAFAAVALVRATEPEDLQDDGLFITDDTFY